MQHHLHPHPYPATPEPERQPKATPTRSHSFDVASGVLSPVAGRLPTAMVPAALGGGGALIATIALLAFAIPFTFLSTNPELEPVEEMVEEPSAA